MQAFDEWADPVIPERLETSECLYISRRAEECRAYHDGVKTMIFIRGYTLQIDLYVYDLDGDRQLEILKWDLGRDGQPDVIEYDVDEDGMLDYAAADMNGNGYFDDDELYVFDSIARRWSPLVLGVLPFPVLPIFPY